MASFRTLDGDIIVTINPAELKAILGSPSGPVIRHLLVLGERVKARALELVPRRTGKLASHIVKRVVSLDGYAAVIVGVDGGQVPYALYVHQGTPPHLIFPRNAPRLVFKGRDGNLVFMPVGAPVHHPGTKARPYLRRALEVLGRACRYFIAHDLHRKARLSQGLPQSVHGCFGRAYGA